MRAIVSMSPWLVILSTLSLSVSCMPQNMSTLQASSVNPVANFDSNTVELPETSRMSFVQRNPEPSKEASTKSEVPSVESLDTAPAPLEQKTESEAVVEAPAASPSKSPMKTPDESTEVSADMTGPGKLKPTIYYFVTINEDNKDCDRGTNLYGTGGSILLNVCKKTAQACAMEGSCGIIQDGEIHAFNILGRSKGRDRYFKIEKGGCRYGYGVRSSCLDPFYTLAADLKVYKPGEVIFVPAVVGTVLPDGSKHSGYFVIRDQGRGIKGVCRFDFFTGTMHWQNPKNPFKKLGLSSEKTSIPYFRVGGKTAQKFLNHRAYPLLPAEVAMEKALLESL